ncbi:MAG: tRNA pseudouridine(13) synthase TruD [Planctomycetota bacterium]
MKLKDAPGDFRVRETLDFVEDREGPFYIHKLRKEKLDTLEAIRLVAEHLGIDRTKIAFAGLKDRQGVTEQWISIEGQRCDWRGPGLEVRFMGRSNEPVTSKLSRGNEFAIVVRSLGPADLRKLEERVPQIVEQGFANYFDDQRFSCLRHGQGFVMKDVLLGYHERALRGLIATPSPLAITGDVKLKKLLAKNWRDWQACRNIARGPVWQRLFEHLLIRPDDFAGALELLPQRTKLIHAYAYQSYLWNRAVDQLLKKDVPSYRQIRLRTEAGTVVSWRRLAEDQRDRLANMRTPLPGPPFEDADEPFAIATAQVLRDAHLAHETFETQGISGMLLKEEPRALLALPRALRVSESEPDDHNPGRRLVELRFGLPRGSYATMLIKHLFADAIGQRPDAPPRAAPDRARTRPRSLPPRGGPRRTRRNADDQDR